MQIILLERVEKLGQMGDVVKVKPGYARNFLLPQGKALRASKENVEKFEAEKAQREADNLSRRTDAEAEAAKMEGLAVSMVRAASEMGQLFGSVNSRDIAEGVTQAGFTIDRNQVIMENSIKTLGLHEIRIRLHPETSVFVTVNVARSLDEAKTQLETGAAVTGVGGEEDEMDPEIAALMRTGFGDDDDEDGDDRAPRGDGPDGESGERDAKSSDDDKSGAGSADDADAGDDSRGEKSAKADSKSDGESEDSASDEDDKAEKADKDAE